MTSYSIRGQVIGAKSRRPLPDLRIEAWDKDLLFDDLLGSAVTDASGAFTIEFDQRYYREILDRRPDVYFKVFRGKQVIADTRGEVLWNLKAPGVKVVILVRDAAAPPAPAGPYHVEGQVTFEDGVGASGLRVEVWDHGLSAEKILATGITDAKGHYLVAYDPAEVEGKALADLQVRLLDPRRKDAEIARSEVVYEAAPEARVDLTVRAAEVTRATEYERLFEAVAPLLGGKALGSLDARGVEYLANKSHWDARLVAMAARAEQLGATTGIPADHHYALLRAGLSDDLAELGATPDATIERALKLAVESGVITSAHSIDATVKIHQQQGAPATRALKPATAASSLGDMLALSLDAAKQAQFVDAYRASAGQPGELWPALRRSGFDEPTIQRLQADGKLGNMTLQNAPLIARLRASAQVSGPEDLARAGLYKVGAWKELIGQDTPPGVAAEAYDAGLAAQVKLQYPTQVAAEMVARGELRIEGAREGDGEVATFLRAGAAEGTLGVDPVKRWRGFGELSAKGREGVLLVERLHQLSPSNESMIALNRQGLGSAYQIARQPLPVFLEKHGDAFPNQTEAMLVHRKAQEIHDTTLNLATQYLSSRSAPNLYAVTGRTDKLPLDLPPDTPGGPTLEELFQNMDYCSCDECKSVLGAAAYFVELLQLIDVPGPKEGKNPQDVLFGRRPDLQHLLLSCENTNVALPYIDIINEILEYHVVNGNLTGFTGHNMREDDETPDLLADPQFVTGAAYDSTRNEVYPHPLPFDMPLAALRLLVRAWGSTLADGLRIFGTKASARREALELNAGEYGLLTSVGFRSLAEYFGEPAGTTIDGLNAAVANGKVFCRRVEIDYQDLVAILRTSFVNPGAALVPALEQLKISLSQLQSWYTGALDDAAFQALLPPGIDASEYGGDVLQWLRDNRSRIMGLILLTDMSAEPQECSFADVELRYALPDSAQNRLDDLAYHKLHRFIRLWKKLGWSIALTDQVLTTFLGVAPGDLTLATIDAAFQALIARLANFVWLAQRQSISTKAIGGWLAIWDATQARDVREAALAHLIRMGVTDLQHLREISNIDPLADDLGSDDPSILGFLDARAALKGAGLKVVDADYLLRSRDDAGALAPTDASILRDLKALRDRMTAVDVDLGTPPGTVDLAYAQSKLSLVYDAAVVDRLVGLVTDGTTYTAPLATAEEALPKKLTDADERIGFDPFKKQLTYRGVMGTGAPAALGAVADGLALADMTAIQAQPDLDAYIVGFKAAAQALFVAGEADVDALAADYPELGTAYAAVQAASPDDRISTLVNQILPSLIRHLKEMSLRSVVAAQLKVDPLLVDALTAGAAVMHADGDAGHGILEDFLALEAAVTLDANQSYTFRIDPPATDDYIVYAGAPAGTTVTLAIDGVTQIPATVVGADGEVRTGAALRLTAGALTPVALTLSGLPAGKTAELGWRTKGMAKAPVPASRLYAEARVTAARASSIRLRKTALLLRVMPLTPRELTHLASVDLDTRGLLDGLDVSGAISASDLEAQWERLAYWVFFSALKKQEPEDDTWVGVLEDPARQTPDGKLILAGAGGWSEADLGAVLTRFGQPIGGVDRLGVLRKVKDATDFVTATGQAGSDLIGWITDSPDAALITTLKDTLRAKQDAASWRATLQSVNDALRNQRRDALVSYILHHASPTPAIDTADKLYEYFLVDVAMDACMKTSRIRLALSTVQLFITRCLMNLEPDVAASSIRADWWAWMKRYRVWEANRQIFLYPENWLEPELRDNKSPIFRDLESELLKSDITDDLAEEAYFNYLKKLDEVARLEIVGCYLEEQAADTQDDDVLHVFGRTIGTTREYHYRRFAYGSWTPWEKISLHIDSDHLFPMVWRGQLFLFWITPAQKPQGGNLNGTPEGMRTQTWSGGALLTVDLHLHWGEYYRGKWTSPKSSELTDPIRLTDLVTFQPEVIVLAGRTEPATQDVAERLFIGLYYKGSPTQAFTITFTSKNSPPLISTVLDPGTFHDVDVFNYELFWRPAPSSVLGTYALREPGKVFKVTIDQPAYALAKAQDETLLTKTAKLFDGFRIRPVMHKIQNQWEAPFFYSDEHSVFFVQAEEVLGGGFFGGFFFSDVPSVNVPPLKIELPPLYEQPVRDPLGPVEKGMGPVVNPLVEGIHPAYEQAISNNNAFSYGGSTFDAGGLAKLGV
jgi:Neuraminidase-like domain/Salmonella virulence plasmid 28.1kDa A protein